MVPPRGFQLWIALFVPLLLAADASPAGKGKSEPRPVSAELRTEIQRREGVLRRAVETVHGVQLRHDAESVQWLARFIEDERDGIDAETRESYEDAIGSFLGETLIEAYGGRWVEAEGGLGVEIEGAGIAFPFTKVSKQFANGEADDIFGLYRVIPAVLDGRVGKRADP